MALDPAKHTVAGSQAAEDVLDELWKPLIGAADPAPMTLEQLNYRWSGIAPASKVTPPFPTPQV